jgi:hypothetical protein
LKSIVFATELDILSARIQLASQWQGKLLDKDAKWLRILSNCVPPTLTDVVQVFIVYGGREGETIGRKVQVYLTSNRIGAFLASPTSSDLNPSEDFQARIDKELKIADLAIVIVTNGINSSKAALREIDRIMDELKYPCIPFVKKGAKLPSKFRDRWRNAYFKSKLPRKAELIELELRMWRFHNQWQISQTVQLQEYENVVPKRASGLVE